MTTYSKTFTLLICHNGIGSSGEYESLNDALSNAFDQRYDLWDVQDDEGKCIVSSFRFRNGHWMELIDPETKQSVYGKAYFKDSDDMHRFLETFDNTYDKHIGAS